MLSCVDPADHKARGISPSQELRLDDCRFQLYLRLTSGQFDDLLARICARTCLHRILILFHFSSNISTREGEANSTNFYGGTSFTAYASDMKFMSI